MTARGEGSPLSENLAPKLTSTDVLAGRTDPQTAIRNLMGRKQKLEHA